MNILYISSDMGLRVLGRKGGAVRVRSLVSAFAAAGQTVLLAAALNGSPWEAPPSVNVEVMHSYFSPLQLFEFMACGVALVRQRFTWDDNAARVIAAVRSLSSGSGARL